MSLRSTYLTFILLLEEKLLQMSSLLTKKLDKFISES